MKRLSSVLSALLVIGLVAVYVFGGSRQAWRAVTTAPHGRDYATYHYAVIQAASGGDPYDSRALGRLARAEGTRSGVHPYFYPPPALLPMVWVVGLSDHPLSLAVGYRTWFWVQQLSLLGVLMVLRRWLGAPLWVLALVLATFSPIADNLKMGQANLPVLLLIVAGLWRRSGLLIGMAAMSKMSPALYLFGWVAQRRARPVIVAMITAVLLSIAALPLVSLQTQLHFYRDVLPGFASGHYNGLTVPINLPANHSLPDLYNQLWPGPDVHTLSPRARVASQLSSLGLLLGLTLALARRPLGGTRASRGPLGEACGFGALTALLLITPVYTYEHHLVWMLLPVTGAALALLRGRLPWTWALALGPAYGALAWPLSWLRVAQAQLPALSWWLQESKFLGVVVVALACLVASLRSPPSAQHD